MTNPSEADLLDVFRYFNNEMSADESALFEDRLEVEIELCEALADIVAVQKTLETASLNDFIIDDDEAAKQLFPAAQIRTDQHRQRNSHSGVAAILGSGLCVALLLLMFSNSLPVQESGPRLATADHLNLDEQALATVDLWTRMESDSNSHTEHVHLSSLPEGESSTDELNVPDWMISALQASEMQDVFSPDDSALHGETL